LMWFCDKCNHNLYDKRFYMRSIEKDFIPTFKEFYGSEDLRTCKKCGHVMEIDECFK
jgi:3-hydroxyanthranilate 3,4-dioxygenase